MYARLKQLRESLGLTQEEFGKSIGIPKTTYNNYETGIRDPKSDFWISVAKKYNVTIDYLMGFSDNPNRLPPLPPESSTYDKDTEKLISLCSQLNKEGKEELINYANYLISQGNYKKVGSFWMGSKEA